MDPHIQKFALCLPASQPGLSVNEYYNLHPSHPLLFSLPDPAEIPEIKGEVRINVDVTIVHQGMNLISLFSQISLV